MPGGASPAPSPSPSPDGDASATCSDEKKPGDTAQPCPLKKVLTLTWDKEETWCSEGGPISGTTTHYADGEALSIAVTDKADGAAVLTLDVKVGGEAFKNDWKVIDVLPVGGPSWKDKRELMGETAGVKTAKPMAVRFIPNVKRGKKDHTAQYDRTDPGATSPKKVGVKCRFELEVTNYLLTIHGALKYVRGKGRERLQLNDATLTGSFTAYGTASHWGYMDAAAGKWKYWDGTAWKDTPATWTADNSNHFGVAFYKSGSSWACRDVPGQSWPVAMADWEEAKYKGPGNTTDTVLGKWKTNMDKVWTDKFDIKRKECKSTKPECCRYKTLCATKWEEAASYSSGETIIIVLEDVRSDAGMWALGDTRDGLAPHEFGHLLGAPDEYGGVGTTQLGVTDSDGLTNGVDADCIMGVNMTTVKKRHLKGIVEVLALLVKDEHGKSYTYEAVDKGANLASPAGTAASPATGSGGGSSIVPVIIGAIVGAIVGAVVGLIASGGNPVAALVGAVVGALAGAGIGSLF
jgi:hypothetical protein